MQGLGLQDLPKPDPPKKRPSGLLVASCAAVMTVYAAGYVRTQNAADRLASQIAKRRATISTPQQAHLSIRDSAGFRGSEREEHGYYEKPIVEGSRHFPVPPKPPLDALFPVVLPDSLSAAAPKTENPVSPETRGTTAPGVAGTGRVSGTCEGTPALCRPPLASADVAALPAPTPVIAAGATTSFLAPPAPAPDTTAVPAQVWRDGSYVGWGYSRHGNIEATVVIEGGRIASAIISQCRTRYSCSVIDRLPPQVAQRQSPDVDYVSGATQSADAFYGAVVEALSKATLK